MEVKSTGDNSSPDKERYESHVSPYCRLVTIFHKINIKNKSVNRLIGIDPSLGKDRHKQQVSTDSCLASLRNKQK